MHEAHESIMKQENLEASKDCNDTGENSKDNESASRN